MSADFDYNLPQARAAGPNGSAKPSAPKAQTAPTPRVAPPTEFPGDPPASGLDGLLYAAHSFRVGSVGVSRLLAVGLLVATLAFSAGLLPLRWFGAGLCLALLTLHLVWSAQARRRDYVRFAETAPPTTRAPALAPGEKLRVHVTGLLTVEGRYRRFTQLPGFYRTFSTGEHAALCLVRDRTWAVLARWPEEEVGMWYAFVLPSSIAAVRWGTVHYGAHVSSAVALHYQLEIPAGPKRRRPELRQETLYLSFADERDGLRLYSDLKATMPLLDPVPGGAGMSA